MRAAGSAGAESAIPGPDETGERNAAAAGAEPPEAGASPDVAGAMEPGAGAEDAPPGDLPSVETLVRQLRPELLATMEELFRTQWSGVKRLRPEDLQRP